MGTKISDGLDSQPNGLAEVLVPHLPSLLAPLHVPSLHKFKPWEGPLQGSLVQHNVILFRAERRVKGLVPQFHNLSLGWLHLT